MIVNSAQLSTAAATIRRRKRPQRIPAADVIVTAAQMDAAARILREAEPSTITSPRHLASTQERPGFIEREDQDAPGVLVFRVGILPSLIYRIDRKGRAAPRCVCGHWHRSGDDGEDVGCWDEDCPCQHFEAAR